MWWVTVTWCVSPLYTVRMFPPVQFSLRCGVSHNYFRISQTSSLHNGVQASGLNYWCVCSNGRPTSAQSKIYQCPTVPQERQPEAAPADGKHEVRSNKTAVIILALEHNETAVLPQRVSFPSTGRKRNLLITDWQCDASLTLADPGDEGAQWWRHHSTAADREENVEKHLGDPAHQNRTETADKILHSFKQIIEKHSELMRILMTSFEEQAELLESFLSM